MTVILQNPTSWFEFPSIKKSNHDVKLNVWFCFPICSALCPKCGFVNLDIAVSSGGTNRIIRSIPHLIVCHIYPYLFPPSLCINKEAIGPMYQNQKMGMCFELRIYLDSEGGGIQIKAREHKAVLRLKQGSPKPLILLQCFKRTLTGILK